MLINKLKIKYLNSNNVLTCYLTDNHISNLELNSESDYMIISAGSITLRLKKIIVKSNELNPKILYLSEDLKNLIYIPEGTVFQIKTLSSDRLELGPIIGIFIPEEDINNLIRGKIINSYIHFTFTCKSLNGLCCFFSTGNIDFINNTVKGIVRQNSKWILSTFPLPKVIYDQNHRINSRMYSIDLRKRLGKEYNILNTMARLKKWETIRTLGKFPKLAKFIPKTTLYKSILDLENSLRDNSSVYLKPNFLSKGKGIFRVTKISEIKYRVEYRTNEENHVATLNSLYDINKLLFQYFFIGKGYIIQQEIKKALFRGKAFDLRVLYQKDYQGEWQPSGISTRISALGSIITSPRSGGTVKDFSTILNEVFNETLSTEHGLYQDILLLGRKVCLAIESAFGNCVELGLDIAIDIHGHIWIIEVNGKPLKLSLKRLNDPELIYKINSRPIEYAAYLLGFESKHVL